MKTNEIHRMIGGRGDETFRLISGEKQKELLLQAEKDRLVTEAKQAEVQINRPIFDVLKKAVDEARLGNVMDDHTPAITKFDAYQAAKFARQEARRDPELSGFVSTMEQAWRKDPGGLFTVAQLGEYRETYRRLRANSAVIEVIDDVFPRHGFQTLDLRKLAQLASEIETQYDFDILIRRAGLHGDTPHQIRARAFVLEQINKRAQVGFPDVEVEGQPMTFEQQFPLGSRVRYSPTGDEGVLLSYDTPGYSAPFSAATVKFDNEEASTWVDRAQIEVAVRQAQGHDLLPTEVNEQQPPRMPEIDGMAPATVMDQSVDDMGAERSSTEARRSQLTEMDPQAPATGGEWMHIQERTTGPGTGDPGLAQEWEAEGYTPEEYFSAVEQAGVPHSPVPEAIMGKEPPPMPPKGGQRRAQGAPSPGIITTPSPPTAAPTPPAPTPAPVMPPSPTPITSEKEEDDNDEEKDGKCKVVGSIKAGVGIIAYKVRQKDGTIAVVPASAMRKKRAQRDDAKRWFEELVDKLGLGFHPDTPFEEYVDSTGARTYTDEEVAQLNQKMEQVFSAVDDPYGLGMEVWQEKGLVASRKKAEDLYGPDVNAQQPDQVPENAAPADDIVGPDSSVAPALDLVPDRINEQQDEDQVDLAPHIAGLLNEAKKEVKKGWGLERGAQLAIENVFPHAPEHLKHAYWNIVVNRMAQSVLNPDTSGDDPVELEPGGQIEPQHPATDQEGVEVPDPIMADDTDSGANMSDIPDVAVEPSSKEAIVDTFVAQPSMRDRQNMAANLDPRLINKLVGPRKPFGHGRKAIQAAMSGKVAQVMDYPAGYGSTLRPSDPPGTPRVLSPGQTGQDENVKIPWGESSITPRAPSFQFEVGLEEMGLPSPEAPIVPEGSRRSPSRRPFGHRAQALDLGSVKTVGELFNWADERGMQVSQKAGEDGNLMLHVYNPATNEDLARLQTKVPNTGRLTDDTAIKRAFSRVAQTGRAHPDAQPAKGDLSFSHSKGQAEGTRWVMKITWNADQLNGMSEKNVAGNVKTYIQQLGTEEEDMDLGTIADVQIDDIDIEGGEAVVSFKSSNIEEATPSQIHMNENEQAKPGGGDPKAVPGRV